MKTVLILLFMTVLLYPSIAQPANAEEIKVILSKHNAWRQSVGVADITYSDKLGEVANEWAVQLNAQGCAFKHSSSNYGENLFRGTAGYYTVGDAVDSWGSEIEDYDYETNKCAAGKACGHYTQIVWAGSTEVGCAQVVCDGMVTWVCNYNPPGNWVGQKPY